MTSEKPLGTGDGVTVDGLGRGGRSCPELGIWHVLPLGSAHSAELHWAWRGPTSRGLQCLAEAALAGESAGALTCHSGS